MIRERLPVNRCLRSGMGRLLALIVAATVPAASQAPAAETITGKVVSVADGDTLTLLVGKTQVKVRLEGIDAPERSQSFGTKAGQVEGLGKDRYKRTLGIVRLDDRNINLDLVREGWAWWYRQYAPKNKELAAAEAEARKEKRGLWADPGPIPPWDWRKQQLSKGQQTTQEIKVVPSGVEIVALLPNPEGEDRGHEQVMIANRNEAAVDLDGWRLKDRAENEFRLAGKVPGRGRLTLAMRAPSMPLNNDGDEVLLIDAGGVVRSQVVYGKNEVRVGQWIERSR
jgi:micrococcal nuclease